MTPWSTCFPTSLVTCRTVEVDASSNTVTCVAISYSRFVFPFDDPLPLFLFKVTTMMVLLHPFFLFEGGCWTWEKVKVCCRWCRWGKHMVQTVTKEQLHPLQLMWCGWHPVYVPSLHKWHPQSQVGLETTLPVATQQCFHFCAQSAGVELSQAHKHGCDAVHLSVNGKKYAVYHAWNWALDSILECHIPLYYRLVQLCSELNGITG